MTYCCKSCPSWDTCETKWYRGEQSKEQFCCDQCPEFSACNPDTKKTAPAKRRKK